MTLRAGVKLGHYPIEVPIRAGGMGEVSRVLERRLIRTAAVAREAFRSTHCDSEGSGAMHLKLLSAQTGTGGYH